MDKREGQESPSAKTQSTQHHAPGTNQQAQAAEQKAPGNQHQAPGTNQQVPKAQSTGIPSLGCGTYNGNFRNWKQFLKNYAGVDPGVLCKEYERIKETVPDLTAKAFEKYKTKNRNPHVPCWDWTRVTLDLPARAYINASYVDGFKDKRRYIIAQGPLPETVVDFWEMIWQKNVCLIVQLGERMEDGIERWAEYWPKEGSGVKDWMRGRFKINLYRDVKYDLLLNSDQNMGNLTLTKIAVYIPKERLKRCVAVLQYADWPYLGIPTQLGALMGIVNQMEPLRKSMYHPNKTAQGYGADLDGPIVVQTADGLGRSGVLVALDIIYTCFKCRGKIEVDGIVRRLREQRAGAIQSPLQYLTIYAALLSDLRDRKPELELDQEKLWKNYKAHFGLV